MERHKRRFYCRISVLSLIFVAFCHPGRFAVLFYDVISEEELKRAADDHQKVALIIPFRDRETQLEAFLDHIHPFLLTQNASFAVYVVEQADNAPFNRAKLFNVGFEEANPDFGCFIFHDVDLLPLDSRNAYRCYEHPVHLTTHVDYFRYKLPYRELMGGVIAVNKATFEAVNGFSNLFFGWGGEDDDFSANRLTPNGFRIKRYAASIGTYRSLKRENEVKTAEKQIEGQGNKLRLTRKMIDPSMDGLSNINYALISKEAKQRYTLIKVKL